MTINEMTKTSSRRDVWFYLAALLFFAGFVIVLVNVVSGNVQSFDQDIMEQVYGMRSPGLNTLFEGITYLGNWEAVTLLCLLLLLFNDSWIKLGIPVALTALLTTLIKAGIKPIVHRARPDEIYFLIKQDGFSFPSGHAITSMGVFALLIFLLWFYYLRGISFSKKDFGKGKMIAVTVALVILAFGIGFSRVYVGVHFITDVLAGWFAGLGVAAICAGVVVFVQGHPDSFPKLRELMAKRTPEEEGPTLAD